MRAQSTWAANLAGEAIRRGWEAASRLGTIRSGDSRSKRFYAYGNDTWVLFPVATILGYDRISLGSHTIVAAYSTLSAGLPDQPANPPWAGPTLTVGDGCVLGRNTTITAHQEVVIGDHVWMGGGVFISDQNHDWADSDVPIGHQAQVAKPVRIGSGTWVGHGAMIMPGADIGGRAVIAAGAVVTGSVPDHAIVGGIPAKVIGSTLIDEVVVPLQPGKTA